MPLAPLRPCTQPGCAALVRRGGSCPEHQGVAQAAERARWAEAEAARASSHERGYDRRWSAARAGFLRKHPLCAECERRGRVTAATVVDHVVPHRGEKTRFWDRANWQPLCRPCHDAKTRRGE